MSTTIAGYLALGTSYTSGVFTELTGTGYVRQAVTLTVLDSVRLINAQGVTFSAGAAWSAATALAVYDTFGNLMMVSPLSAPVTVPSGGTLSYGDSALVFMVPALIAGLAVTPNVVFAPGTQIGTLFGQPVYAGSTLTAISNALVTSSRSGWVSCAKRAPTNTDDSAHGYAVGALWNCPSGLYQNIRNTTNLATWQRIDSLNPHPIDAVGGTAPAAAYGTRKLRNAYAGAAFNVVRASDSTALDIGFLADGSLDTKTLDAFLALTSGRIATWYDQSGNGRNATQATAGNRPTVSNWNMCGNARSIVFDGWSVVQTGSQESMIIPSTVSVNSQAFHVGMVARFTSAAGYLGLFSLANAAGNFEFGNYFESGLGALDTSTNYFLTQYGSMSLFGSNNPQVYQVDCTSSGNYTAFVTADGTYASAYPNTYRTLAGGFIGAAPTLFNGGAGVWGGAEFSAFIIWGRSLSATEQLNEQASLNLAFGLVPQQRESLSVQGDSISAGNLNTYLKTWPRRMEEFLDPGIRIFNTSYTGQTSVQAAIQYVNVGAKIPIVPGGNNIVVYFLGTNDINAGSSAAATFASIQSACQTIQARGNVVVLCTVLPRQAFIPAAQVQWALLLAMLDANWQNFASAFVNFANDPTMGPATAVSNTALYADGTHPTDLGNCYILQDIYQALAPLLV